MSVLVQTSLGLFMNHVFMPELAFSDCVIGASAHRACSLHCTLAQLLSEFS